MAITTSKSVPRRGDGDRCVDCSSEAHDCGMTQARAGCQS